MFDITPTLDCGGRSCGLDRPRVMGIVNVTPDSFSDGGAHDTPRPRSRTACGWRKRAPTCSTSAANRPVPAPTRCRVDEELRRVIPVIERLARETSLPISIDTSKPEVMRAARRRRRRHDQRRHALRRDGALDAAAALGVPVVLMHMQGEPRDHAGRTRTTTTSSPRCTASSPSASSRARWPASPRSGSSSIRASASARPREHNLALLRALDALRRTRRAGAGRPVAQAHDRRTHRPRAAARARARLGGRAPASPRSAAR